MITRNDNNKNQYAKKHYLQIITCGLLSSYPRNKVVFDTLPGCVALAIERIGGKE